MIQFTDESFSVYESISIPDFEFDDIEGEETVIQLSDAEKALLCYNKTLLDAYSPDPIVTVSEWADERRVLPQKSSAEPGRYRTSRTPYAREIMDALSVTSPVKDVSFMASAQVSKTEIALNWVGYSIDYAPCPILIVQPTVDTVKRFSKQRLTPMINDTPTLSSKVAENKSRDNSNSIFEKEFPGGMAILTGANSAAGLRSMPIKNAVCDEISNWNDDVDGEGDPLALVYARMATFSRGKIYKCSTPSNAGRCRIESEFLNGDQRRYFVPCPHCGHMHTLEWENFVIPKDEDGGYRFKDAHMVCPSCKQRIDEHHKTEMLKEKGYGGIAEWRITCPEHVNPERRSYTVNTLYAPVGWKSWRKIAREWVEAQGNVSKLKAFTNNVLSRTWQEDVIRLDEHALMTRAEDYESTSLNDRVLVLTAGADVQINRIEIEIVGWGVGEESWSLDYQVFWGDPNSPTVWQQIDAYLMTNYNHPSGAILRPARIFIDSGGANTKEVYEYCSVRTAVGMMPIKGRGGDGVPAVTPPSVKGTTTKPWSLGSNALKDSVMGRLRIEKQGAGYCHFPTRYAKEYFEGLTSEEVKYRFVKGRAVREYVVQANRRNEPFDCRCYAYAAFLSLNVDMTQLSLMMAGQAAPIAQDTGRQIRGSMETVG